MSFRFKFGKMIVLAGLAGGLVFTSYRTLQTQMVSPMSPVTADRTLRLSPSPVSTTIVTLHSPLTPIFISPLPTPTLQIHLVQPGEYPLLIAEKYSVTVETLMALNHITDPTTLQVGQPLFIPAGSALPVDEPTALASPTLTSTVTTTQTITMTPTITTPVVGLAALEREVLQAVNAERAAEGLPPYLPDAVLTEVAQAHARDMIERGYFDHVTPDGKALRDRLQDRGLELHWVGENIQRNTQPRDKTVQEAISWFMNSTPHRKNILHQHYTHLGVGVVEQPPGWYTFVLVFAQL